MFDQACYLEQGTRVRRDSAHKINEKQHTMPCFPNWFFPLSLTHTGGALLVTMRPLSYATGSPSSPRMSSAVVALSFFSPSSAAAVGGLLRRQAAPVHFLESPLCDLMQVSKSFRNGKPLGCRTDEKGTLCQGRLRKIRSPGWFAASPFYGPKD